MSNLQSIRLTALIGACVISMGSFAHAQGTGGSDISGPGTATTPAATPAAAPAQTSSLGTFTLGVGGVTQSSAYFGRYNGMPESGVGVMAGWNIGTRDAWDSGTTRYYNFTGDNINVGFGGGFAPEGNIDLSLGDQGTWSAFANYDAMTYTASNNFTSILDSNGYLSKGYVSALTSLGVGGPFISNYSSATAPTYFGSIGSAKHYPHGLNIQTGSVGSTVGHVLGAGILYPASPPAPGFSSTASPSNYDTYLASLNELVTKVGTRRDKGTIGGKYDLGSWTFGAVVSHEHKEGTLEQSMTTAGSNSGFATFPMPVDYDTDAYIVTAAYDTDVMQAHFSYEFSNFIDHNNGGFQTQGWNFTEVRTGSASPYNYTSYELSGVYSLPPSNQAHTLSGEFAYNVDPQTRVNATVVYGLQLQNSAFAAPTLDQYALTNFASYFNSNPSSLDGLVQTWFANFTANSKLWSAVGLKLSYTLDARDPSTKPMAIYGDPTDAVTPSTINFTPAPAGSGCTATPCAVPWQRIAMPESWTKQTIALTADYRFDTSTKISLGYAFKDDERANAITHHAQDNSGSVKLSSTVTPDMTASIGYVHSDRTASAPDFSLWTQQIMADCISNTNGVFVPGSLGCQQVPFYEAARTQDAVDARLTDQIDPKTSFSMFGKFSNDQYHNPLSFYDGNTLPSVGINRDYSIQGGPDFNYRASSDLEFHTYYTFLRTYRAMRALNGEGTSVSIPGVDYYSENTTYDIHTAGIGSTWQVDDKMKLAADYIFSYGSQAFAQSGSWTTGQGGQLVGGDPNLSTKSANNQFKVHMSYDYSASMQLYLGYEFDSLYMGDWAMVGRSVGQVLTGDVPPKYDVSTIMAAVTVKI